MSNLVLGSPIGTHLLINAYDVPPRLLEYADQVLPLLDNIVNMLNLHVVSQSGYQFQPVGYTHAYVLSESHFTIHTYPEHCSCYIDIFCCNPEFSPTQAIQLIQIYFLTSNIRYQVIQR
uniref:S-adenosylmethionine decarboxylase n=1 Tax=viral metagenome TaxID=1070528 RepID=A0A6C0KUY7_9ZZZZ